MARSVSKDSVKRFGSQQKFKYEMQQAQMLEKDSSMLLQQFRLSKMNKPIAEPQTKEIKPAKLMKLRQFTVNALQKKKEKPEEQKLNFKKDNSEQRSKTGRLY